MSSLNIHDYLSNMHHTYLIVGRSGVGKDSIANKLSNFDLKVLKSYTTRPKRSESDDSHEFVTDKYVSFVDDMIAYTELNGYKYFATREQLDKSDIYIIDPTGIQELCKSVPKDYKFTIIYVYSDADVARELAASRFADISEGYQVYDDRRNDEDKQFSNFEDIVADNNIYALPNNIISILPVENKYNSESLNNNVKLILNDAYMKIAISEAYSGIEHKHGGPFGSTIVKDGKVVGSGHNQVLLNNDPTCHGEMQAIRDACSNLNTFDLSGCELFTTAAPCPMCLGGILWSNIKKVYYGCSIQDTNNIGFRDEIFYTFMNTNFDNTDLLEQINHSECLKLFDDYVKMTDKRY